MSLFVAGSNEFGELKVVKCSEFNIKHIACGYDYNIYLDSEDNFLCCGNNKYGQCSVDNSDELIENQEITFFKQNNIKIFKICLSISGRCSFWITQEHTLYANGLNAFGQLGFGLVNQHKPSVVPRLQHVIDAKSSFNYSIALCSIFNIEMLISHWFKVHDDIIKVIKVFYGETDKVFSTLYSEYGGNGHGIAYTNVNGKKGEWKQIKALRHKKIIKIATGVQHSMFLQSNGVVWTCGFNKWGQLGLSHCRTVALPTKIGYFIKNNINITDICCGLVHTLALNKNGNVYSWGINSNGQCGDGTNKNIYCPKLIDSLKHSKVKNIGCGKCHSYVGTYDGKHFLFGSNAFNECITTDGECVMIPCLVNSLIAAKTNGKKIKKVYLGQYNTIFVLENH